MYHDENFRLKSLEILIRDNDIWFNGYEEHRRPSALG